ncbi:hypothetical protein WJX82_004231 [Trebouxia sp. C0006]
MLDEQLITRALFGGAIEMSLPQRFVDVSDYRPVPDHQEVWTDATLDQSVILEIVEHQPVPDQDCCKFQLQKADKKFMQPMTFRFSLLSLDILTEIQTFWSP